MPALGVLMIRPAAFAYNAETAQNNVFQKNIALDNVNSLAEQEFDNLVNVLRAHKISVWVIQDSMIPPTPDSIFPNNWISFHDGKVVLYPMYATNRRAERKPETLSEIQAFYAIKEKLDFTHYETQNKFLEGTGSMVLDRVHHKAYACISERTDTEILHEFCKKLNYQAISFNAIDENGFPIYHTNVMMNVGNDYAVICLASIAEDCDKLKVINCLLDDGKQIIDISYAQMNAFAGNMLQVFNENNQPFTVMSQAAFNSLDASQITMIERFGNIIAAPIPTIETLGGGSVRCMLAEVF